MWTARAGSHRATPGCSPPLVSAGPRRRSAARNGTNPSPDEIDPLPKSAVTFLRGTTGSRDPVPGRLHALTGRMSPSMPACAGRCRMSRHGSPGGTGNFRSDPAGIRSTSFRSGRSVRSCWPSVASCRPAIESRMERTRLDRATTGTRCKRLSIDVQALEICTTEKGAARLRRSQSQARFDYPIACHRRIWNGNMGLSHIPRHPLDPPLRIGLLRRRSGSRPPQLLMHLGRICRPLPEPKQS